MTREEFIKLLKKPNRITMKLNRLQVAGEKRILNSGCNPNFIIYALLDNSLQSAGLLETSMKVRGGI